MSFKRCYTSIRRLYATATEQQPMKLDKLSRQQMVDEANMLHALKLHRLDQEFDLFKGVHKVLDLGYVPGNWSSYTKYKLCLLHNLNDTDFNKKCHILGFDVLFGTPPEGISSIQGNIYSKLLQKNILNHFKEIALRKYEQGDHNDSYFVKEMKEYQLDREIEELTEKEKDESEEVNVSEVSDKLAEMELAENTKEADDSIEDMTLGLTNLSLVDLSEKQQQKFHQRRKQVLQNLQYKPDLILADLCTPFMQQTGFFNNTNTRPYTRFNTREALNKPIVDPPKASIDLNDAALHMACNVLKPTGTFVTRLAKADILDPEVKLYENRLKKVFNNVNQRNGTAGTTEVFFVAKDKKTDDEFDIDTLF